MGLRAGDRYLVALPFFHSFGYKAGWLACLMMGATAFPLAVFDVNAVLERVERHAITVLPGPPSLYQSILARDDLRVTRIDVAASRRHWRRGHSGRSRRPDAREARASTPC